MGLEFYVNAKTMYRPQEIKEVKNIVILLNPCTLGLQITSLCQFKEPHDLEYSSRCKLPVKFHMGPELMLFANHSQ
jgi:hypothetical protein